MHNRAYLSTLDYYSLNHTQKSLRFYDFSIDKHHIIWYNLLVNKWLKYLNRKRELKNEKIYP